MHTGGGGGGGGTSCTPLNDFEKLDHKNAITHQNRGPPSRFSHNPKYPIKKFVNDSGFMDLRQQKIHEFFKN